MTDVGIIFANLHDRSIPELTRKRATASVPFGGRYRLIDFPLANMVNANITDIRIVTHYNYSSLMDHIGSGKDWDMARRTGGIKLLPPNMNTGHGAASAPSSRLEALKNNVETISRITSKHVVFSDCDAICNVDLSALIADHDASGAEITMLVKETEFRGPVDEKLSLIDYDETGRVTRVEVNPIYVTGRRSKDLNIWVVNTDFLRRTVQEAIARGYTSLNRDIISRTCGSSFFRAVPYTGYIARISSFRDYFAHSMQLLENSDVFDALFGVRSRPVYTKVHNTAPTRYSEEAIVRNSLVADGCVIEGVVENSILFRGVHVGKDTVIRNCILFQNTKVGKECFLNCTVSDKNAVISDEQMLSGHPSQPYFIEKGKVI